MCVFNNVNTHIWLWKYAYLMMLVYGRDESAPAPGGMFAPHFVGVRHIFAIRQQHFGKPLAAVGDRFIVPAYMYSQQH